MIFLGNRFVKGVREKVYLVDEENIDIQPLSPLRSQNVERFSDGFAWGYSGDGPSQLALALLLEVTNDEKLSVELCLSFREHLIEGITENCWAITADLIQGWIDHYFTELENRIEEEEERIKEIRQQLEESEKNLGVMRQSLAAMRKC